MDEIKPILTDEQMQAISEAMKPLADFANYLVEIMSKAWESILDFLRRFSAAFFNSPGWKRICRLTRAYRAKPKPARIHKNTAKRLIRHIPESVLRKCIEQSI